MNRVPSLYYLPFLVFSALLVFSLSTGRDISLTQFLLVVAAACPILGLEVFRFRIEQQTKEPIRKPEPGFRRGRWTSLAVFAIIGLIVAVWIAWPFWIGFWLEDNAWKGGGEFGDSFGGLTALFSSLTLAGLIYGFYLEAKHRREDDERRREDEKINAHKSLIESLKFQMEMVNDGRGSKVYDLYAPREFLTRIKHHSERLDALLSHQEFNREDAKSAFKILFEEGLKKEKERFWNQSQIKISNDQGEIGNRLKAFGILTKEQLKEFFRDYESFESINTLYMGIFGRPIDVEGYAVWGTRLHKASYENKSNEIWAIAQELRRTNMRDRISRQATCGFRVQSELSNDLIVRSDHLHVLSNDHDSVPLDLAEGTRVYAIIYGPMLGNSGFGSNRFIPLDLSKEIFEYKIKGELISQICKKAIDFAQIEATLEYRHLDCVGNLYWLLTYPYFKRFRRLDLDFSFEIETDFGKITHTYRTKYGYFKFYRVFAGDFPLEYADIRQVGCRLCEKVFGENWISDCANKIYYDSLRWVITEPNPKSNDDKFVVQMEYPEEINGREVYHRLTASWRKSDFSDLEIGAPAEYGKEAFASPESSSTPQSGE